MAIRRNQAVALKSYDGMKKLNSISAAQSSKDGVAPLRPTTMVTNDLKASRQHVRSSTITSTTDANQSRVRPLSSIGGGFKVSRKGRNLKSSQRYTDITPFTPDSSIFAANRGHKKEFQTL